MVIPISLLGIKEEGIFRLSGHRKEVEKIVDMYDEGEEVNLEKINIHSVAGLYTVVSD